MTEFQIGVVNPYLQLLITLHFSILVMEDMIAVFNCCSTSHSFSGLNYCKKLPVRLKL